MVNMSTCELARDGEHGAGRLLTAARSVAGTLAARLFHHDLFHGIAHLLAGQLIRENAPEMRHDVNLDGLLVLPQCQQLPQFGVVGDEGLGGRR
jgi:hypothetical protein